jgi:2-hydroxychromene-2-carboxylate isomerase/predicted thioesterase
MGRRRKAGAAALRTAPVGLAAVHVVLPGPEACASAIGNDGVDVVSSPWLVGLLEEASHRAVRDLFEPSEGSVGVRLELSHRAPALPGREVTAHARLVAAEGRRLRFDVEAFQGSVSLMRGVHERALVDLDRFMATVRGAAAAPPRVTEGTPIEFYLDFHSPWCWFASLRIEALAARVRRQVDWRPIHLARLIETIDGRRPLEANAAFVAWFKQDMQDTAQQLGLTLRYHPRFPLRPGRALRASVHAAQKGLAGPFVQAVMRAYWSDAGDIEDADLLAAIGVRCGLLADDIRAAVAGDACKRAVEANTAQAIARGGFGAPTFFCDGRLFWGNDRMDRLEAWAASRLAG